MEEVSGKFLIFSLVSGDLLDFAGKSGYNIAGFKEREKRILL